MSSIPENWELVTIEDIARSGSGAIRIGPFGSALKKHEYADSGVRVLGIEDVFPNRLMSARIKYISEQKYQELTQYTVESGDILVTNMGTVGRTCFVPEDLETSIISSHLIKVSLNKQKAWPPYVSWALNFCPSVLSQIQLRCQGAIMAGFNSSLLKQLRIPLPPLREQRRIAEILDKADTMLARRNAALDRIETLTRSIFLDMFGDPTTNPKGWPIKRIGDITECLDRLRRPVTESDRQPGKVPYYGANGQQGWINAALFNEALVLVAEDGGYFDEPQRGVAYRIDGPAWVNNHAHILRARSEFVEIEFLHRALRHYDFRPYISGTTRAKLTQGQLNSAKLFVPPLVLQRQFAERITVTKAVESSVVASRDKLETLLAAITERAFQGVL